MASKIRIRAKIKDGYTEIKCLMGHVMETGLRKDKAGEEIPAHFIKEVVCEHNGNQVMLASWGIAVSKNPYLSFRLRDGAVGDTVKISWSDNKGESASAEAKIT